MKKTIISTFALASMFCLGTELAAAPENPVNTMFENDIIFSLNFNDGTLNADMANGKGEPKKVKQPAKFIEKGLFGKGLADGWINYDAKQNIDLTVPGTLIYWVAPTWDSKKPANGKEPGFTAVQIRGKSKEYNYTMISGKMHGQPWGHGHFNTYVQYPGAKIKHVNCENMNVARAGIWKKGQWKMKAITWNGGKFAVSVNGSPSRSSTLKKMMIGETVYMELGVGGGKQIMIDEVTVLNRALSDVEIKKLYDATIKALGTK